MTFVAYMEPGIFDYFASHGKFHFEGRRAFVGSVEVKRNDPIPAQEVKLYDLLGAYCDVRVRSVWRISAS